MARYSEFESQDRSLERTTSARALPGEREQGAQPKMEQAKQKARGFGDRMKTRANRMVENRKEQVADRIEDVGERLEQRAEPLEEQGGLRGRAGRVVHRTGDRIEQSASYLRDNELSEIGSDAKTQIREHPFLSVGTALGTGFVLGAIVTGRDDEGESRTESRSERGAEGQGRFGRVGRKLLSGAAGMAARGVQNRIAGQKRQR